MKKRTMITAALFLSLTLLSGCGATTSDNASTTKDATKQAPLKIGIAQIAPHASLDNCRDGFIEGLKEEGFVDGDNITIDYKNAEGDTANATMIADTFVSQKYDLICAVATPTAMAAYNATQGTDIPVIFTAVSDPVAAELVASLDKPDTNATGTSDALPLEQQMQMIRAMMPDAKTIGILYTTSEVNSQTHLEKFKELAPTYGFTIEAIGVNTASDIPLAMDTLVTKCDAINNFTDNNVVNNLDTVLAKANDAGIPVFGSEIEQVKKGCVAAQNIDYYQLGITTGKMAAKVLNGEDIKTMPVEVISACTPVANQAVMDQFSLTMPQEYKDSVTYVSAEE
ncbi:MAG: putative tryptophan/tyrosine transport system substrate-binding protein [Clostridiales bacterium]|nr:putative tryptophan/tyrosine transport system substrate-binding protein [Clostridiales bacterium]